jgi:hydrogenase maturation protein HypF
MGARVEGVVQGVGFRPFSHRLACELGLSGWVGNDELGVALEVEGSPEAVSDFLGRLAREAPPLAVVERVRTVPLETTGEEGFAILDSRRSGSAAAVAQVAPDSAPCEACLGELMDPADRRYRYPFINCTDCGPRFTIVGSVPYDRARTTMAGFEMCGECRTEYEDPAGRRFHAQPNACPRCGPRARLVELTGGTLREMAMNPARETLHETAGDLAGTPRQGTAEDPVRAAAAELLAGRIVAVKGLGGYHLACRADDEGTVSELRRRKGREEKAFAVMARDLPAARALVHLRAVDEDFMKGRRRPIVIAQGRPGGQVAESVAPGSPELGVMLPSTPLHHLLLADVGIPLVMTSGNLSEEPIAYRDEEALERLGGIADVLLVHDRPIEVRVDDSVVRSLGADSRAGEDGHADARSAGTAEAGTAEAGTAEAAPPLMLRRARGYVPASLPLPVQAPPLLACGAELKSTFCLAKGSRAWVSHHIGDLKNWETLRSFREGVAHFEALFEIAPEAIAHDLHPDYLSSGYALERQGTESEPDSESHSRPAPESHRRRWPEPDGVRLIAVQHHHAHMAACLAEHGERGQAIGVIYDGTGLGEDGTIWGGELLAGNIERVERVGHLQPVGLPGGDAAAREPWRMACAWLTAAHGEEAVAPPPRIAGRVDGERWKQVAELARSGTASPTTTSVGRLFDGVAALCGIRLVAHEEGRAAMELEWAAMSAEAAGEGGAYPMPVVDGEMLRLEARETVLAIEGDLAAGTSAAVVSARFHNGLADATATAVTLAAQRRGLDTAVLSGGVFQNRLLLRRTAGALEQVGLRVLIPQALPPNDGGISYGQAAVAATRLISRV